MERFTYEYNFGDSWVHNIRIEAILRIDPDKRYPVCVAGSAPRGLRTAADRMPSWKIAGNTGLLTCRLPKRKSACRTCAPPLERFARRDVVRNRGDSSAVRTRCANRRKQQEPSQTEEVLATDFSVRAMISLNILIIGSQSRLNAAWTGCNVFSFFAPPSPRYPEPVTRLAAPSTLRQAERGGCIEIAWRALWERPALTVLHQSRYLAYGRAHKRSLGDVHAREPG